MINPLKNTLKILVVFLTLWAGGFALFFQNVPKHASTDQTHAEAIVVLTGGRDRLKTGFQLLCQGRSDLIFISGVHPEESLKSVLKTTEVSEAMCGHDQDWLQAQTHLGHAATNTQENAAEVTQWLKMKKITSIFLVTAAYHMPRSLLEFNRQLPEATIIPYPVFPRKLQGSRWWLGEKTVPLMISEYHKFLWAFMRMHAITRVRD